MAFKVTEEALEQEVAIQLSGLLGCQYVTQVGLQKGQLDFLLLCDNHRLVIEIEVGKGWSKFAKGIVQANGYKEQLQADGIITLMYPESVRKVINTQEDLKDIAVAHKPQVLILSPFVNEYFTEIAIPELADFLKSYLTKITLTVSPNLIVNTLRDCVQSVSLILRRERGIRQPAVDAVVGTYDLFRTLADTPKKEEKKLQLALCDLTAYIFLNQLLLYHLLSKPLNLPLLDHLDDLNELKKYFQRVTDINYRAVYQVDIFDVLPPQTLPEINIAILSLKAIKPEFMPHDILGRVFHEFLPFETRKLLGTFYTKPVAAEILAGLSINSPNATVIDVACGSGTLLVAAYRRKLSLNPNKSHKEMVENEIVGIDVMPFAAHLAALNLTLQNVQEATNKTLIGSANALDLREGMQVKGSLLQLHLYSKLEKIDKNIFDENIAELTIPANIDVVIMNPPFTRKESLTDAMKGSLLTVFEHGQNYWAYFLFLADLLLKDKGVMGAVLPRDIVVGQYSEDVRKWLFTKNNYTLKYLVKTVNETAFSEKARFRDFLVVLEKGVTYENPLTGIVYLKKKLQDISLHQADIIVNKILNLKQGEDFEDDKIIVTWVKAEFIKDNTEKLAPLIAFASPQNAKILLNLQKKMVNSGNNFKKLGDAEFEIIRGLEPTVKGLLNALFIVNPYKPERIEKSLLILQRDNARGVLFSIKGINSILTTKKKLIRHGLKTPAYLERLDVSDTHDWLISERFQDFEKVEKLLGRKVDFGAVQNQIENKETYLAVSRRINLSAPGTKLLAYYNDSLFVPGKAFWSVRVSKNLSKLLCLWFNSTLSIAQVLLHRTETEGAWCELTKESLNVIYVPNMDNFEKKEKEISRIFDKYKKVEWIPLIEQYSRKFQPRISIDSELLQFLGFSQAEIKKLLTKTYRVIGEELSVMKASMGHRSQKESVDDLGLDLDE